MRRSVIGLALFVSGAAPASAPPPPPDESQELPAGRGVALYAEQLVELVQDPRMRDPKASHESRLAMVTAVLGPGEEIDEDHFDGYRERGQRWRALAARGMFLPFGCRELVVARNHAFIYTRDADHRACGLPYVEDPSKPYPSKAPHHTKYLLDQVLAEVVSLDPDVALARAEQRLRKPDGEDHGEKVWNAIGGAGKHAPITCHSLRVGGRARIEEVPLRACDLQWPMPGMTFDVRAEIPPLDKRGLLAECTKKCAAANELCMMDERLPSGGTLHYERDGQRVRFLDGKPLEGELRTSCVPVPATCAKADTACFWPRSAVTPAAQPSPGPCPKDGHTGHGIANTTPPYIICHSRFGTSMARLPPPSSSAFPPHP